MSKFPELKDNRNLTFGRFASPLVVSCALINRLLGLFERSSTILAGCQVEFVLKQLVYDLRIRCLGYVHRPESKY